MLRTRSYFEKEVTVGGDRPQVLIHQKLQLIHRVAEGGHSGHNSVVIGVGHLLDVLDGVHTVHQRFELVQGGGGVGQIGADLDEQLALDGEVGLGTAGGHSGYGLAQPGGIGDSGGDVVLGGCLLYTSRCV